MAEFTHFIFPVLKPAIHPELAGTISQAVSNGRFVDGMHNYWVQTTGVYYFPGMYTAILPMIPGIYAIRRVISASKRAALMDVSAAGAVPAGVQPPGAEA